MELSATHAQDNSAAWQCSLQLSPLMLQAPIAGGVAMDDHEVTTLQREADELQKLVSRSQMLLTYEEQRCEMLLRECDLAKSRLSITESRRRATEQAIDRYKVAIGRQCTLVQQLCATQHPSDEQSSVQQTTLNGTANPPTQLPQPIVDGAQMSGTFAGAQVANCVTEKAVSNSLILPMQPMQTTQAGAPQPFFFLPNAPPGGFVTFTLLQNPDGSSCLQTAPQDVPVAQNSMPPNAQMTMSEPQSITQLIEEHGEVVQVSALRSRQVSSTPAASAIANRRETRSAANAGSANKSSPTSKHSKRGGKGDGKVTRKHGHRKPSSRSRCANREISQDIPHRFWNSLYPYLQNDPKMTWVELRDKILQEAQNDELMKVVQTTCFYHGGLFIAYWRKNGSVRKQRGRPRIVKQDDFAGDPKNFRYVDVPRCYWRQLHEYLERDSSLSWAELRQMVSKELGDCEMLKALHQVRYRDGCLFISTWRRKRNKVQRQLGLDDLDYGPQLPPNVPPPSDLLVHTTNASNGGDQLSGSHSANAFDFHMFDNLIPADLNAVDQSALSCLATLASSASAVEETHNSPEAATSSSKVTSETPDQVISGENCQADPVSAGEKQSNQSPVQTVHPDTRELQHTNSSGCPTSESPLGVTISSACSSLVSSDELAVSKTSNVAVEVTHSMLQGVEPISEASSPNNEPFVEENLITQLGIFL